MRTVQKLGWCMAVWVAVGVARADEQYGLLVIESVGGERLISTDVDFDDLRAVLQVAVPGSAVVKPGVFIEQGSVLTPLVSQFDRGQGGKGRLTVLLPESSPPGARVRLYLRPQPAKEVAVAPKVLVRQEEGRVIVNNGYAEVVHDPGRHGGLPSKVTVAKTGKVFEGFYFNDRVHDKKLGSFSLCNDPNAEIQVLRLGPLEVVVQVRARYLQGTKPPPSKPLAVYEFTYRAGSPGIEVAARIEQQSDFVWNELHLVEWNFPARPLPQWATGEPRKTGRFGKDVQSLSGSRWACLSDGANVFGVLASPTKLYSGTSSYGSYVHGPWVRWSERTASLRCTMWVAGGGDATIDELQRRAVSTGGPARVRVSTPGLETLRADVAKQIDRLARGRVRGLARWQHSLIDRKWRRGAALPHIQSMLTAQADILKRKGSGEQVLKTIRQLAGQRPVVTSDEAALMLADAAEGLSPVSLFSLAEERELLSGRIEPLWQMDVTGEKNQSHTWTNMSEEFTGRISGTGNQITLTWRGSGEASAFVATVELSLADRAAAWKLSIENKSDGLSIRRVWFPKIFMCGIGESVEDDTFLSPVVSGILSPAPLVNGVDCNAIYPGGWGTMQFGAHWDGDCGLYYGAHDPVASTKRFQASRRQEPACIEVRIEWPAADATRAGNDFQHSGNVTLATFSGDWYDATQIYRKWVESEAQWWPLRGRWDRPDTPKWMKEVCVWALASGTPEEVVGPTKAFAEFMGVPTALHWYRWHQIPFDNDYPHYFPVKKGFPEGVAELQKAGVRVMPYINGRLWDSDTEDFKTVALPATTKKTDGAYYIEHYGKNPQDLVPMCPTQQVWHKKVHEIVLRLLGGEFNVDGVYVDQVAAAHPVECYDRSHGHPLGGGGWWTTKGYWPMLTTLNKIIDEKFPNKMLTTECTAEPFTHVFDGYLTWNYQNQDMVPAFAAIYGGKIQMFSRAYGGDEQLAYWMKMAQSLVFGEQLGWIAPSIVKSRPVTAAYLRRCSRMRHRLLEYLSWGRMARPPRVTGRIPRVTADWAWRPNWPITDSALQRNAWQAEDGSVAFIFANSTEKPLEFIWEFDGRKYDLSDSALRCERVDENGRSAAGTIKATARRPMRLAPLAIEAIIVRGR